MDIQFGRLEVLEKFLRLSRMFVEDKTIQIQEIFKEEVILKYPMPTLKMTTIISFQLGIQYTKGSIKRLKSILSLGTLRGKTLGTGKCSEDAAVSMHRQ